MVYCRIKCRNHKPFHICKYANGSFVNYGNYIVYTVAPGDVLSGIGQRFGVSYMQIAQWNHIKNPDLICIGQKLTIYPAVLR